MRRGFTLIEVMVAVMIISVVIATLLQMRGNSTFMFLDLNEKSKIYQYGSFFTKNSKYGFENDTTYLDELVSEFEVENDLRRKFQNTKVEIVYQEIGIINMTDFALDASDENINENDESQEASALVMVFEVGKTILKTPTTSTAFLRIRLQ